MSGETPTFKFKYAEAADEVNKFPVNVDEPKTKSIEKVIEERTLTYKTRAASFEAVTGEVSECTKAITVTLPAATVNRLIGVVSIPAVAGELVKITTSGGAFIIGDFITAASKTATITLTEGQHVLLFASGTNWFIIAGEPKREQKYEALKSLTGPEMETGFEASASRPALVLFKAGSAGTPTVGGVAIINTGGPATVLLPPGQKLKATVATELSVVLL